MQESLKSVKNSFGPYTIIYTFLVHIWSHTWVLFNCLLNSAQLYCVFPNHIFRLLSILGDKGLLKLKQKVQNEDHASFY